MGLIDSIQHRRVVGTFVLLLLIDERMDDDEEDGDVKSSSIFYFAPKICSTSKEKGGEKKGISILRFEFWTAFGQNFLVKAC